MNYTDYEVMQQIKIDNAEMVWAGVVGVVLLVVCALYLIRQINRYRKYVTERVTAIEQNHTFESVVKRNAKASFVNYCNETEAEDYLEKILNKQ